MKFTVFLKDPDGFSSALDDALEAQLAELNLPEDEKEELRDIKRQKLSDFIDKWVEYDEYVKLEFDMEAGTATVVPRK